MTAMIHLGEPNGGKQEENCTKMKGNVQKKGWKSI